MNRGLARATAAAAGTACAALVLLGACGTGESATVPASTIDGTGPTATAIVSPAAGAVAVCDRAARTPAVHGYGTQSLVAARSMTAGEFTAWHGPAPRINGQGPLDGVAASAPVTVCLWKADDLAPDVPPPAPGSHAKPLVVDAVEMLITDTGPATMFSMGEAKSTARQLRALR